MLTVAVSLRAYDTAEIGVPFFTPSAGTTMSD